MPKFTALAIALLTVMSIAPKSHAMSTTANAVSARQPAGDLHAQIIIKLGGNDRSYRDDGSDRQIEREREVERRREYYSQRRQDRERYRQERYHHDRRYDERRYDERRYDERRDDDRRDYRH